MVVVMAGDDGDEQRTERTEQKGFATVDVMNLRHTEHTYTDPHKLLGCSFSHTDSHTHAHTLSPSHSHTHSHTHTPSHSHPDTVRHTHKKNTRLPLSWYT